MLTSLQPSTPLFFLSSLGVRTLHRHCQKSPSLSLCFIWLPGGYRWSERRGGGGGVLAFWEAPAQPNKSSQTRGWDLIKRGGRSSLFAWLRLLRQGQHTLWNEDFENQMIVSLVLVSSNFILLNAIQNWSRSFPMGKCSNPSLFFFIFFIFLKYSGPLGALSGVCFLV